MNWGWINTAGLVIVILMLVPNVIYAFKARHAGKKRTNKALSIFCGNLPRLTIAP